MNRIDNLIIKYSRLYNRQSLGTKRAIFCVGFAIIVFLVLT